MLLTELATIRMLLTTIDPKFLIVPVIKQPCSAELILISANTPASDSYQLINPLIWIRNLHHKTHVKVQQAKFLFHLHGVIVVPFFWGQFLDEPLQRGGQRVDAVEPAGLCSKPTWFRV